VLHSKKAKLVVRQGYKKIAGLYHQRRLDSTGTTKLLNFLTKKLPKKDKVLDVGCGGGYPVAKFFSDKGYKVTGIDISKEMIGIAKKTVPNGKFYVKEMTKLNFPKESFDIITSFFAIIHVPRKEHKKILKQFYKLLKPNGMILISMGIQDCKEFTKIWHDDVNMYWSTFDKKTNHKIIKEIGFKIIWDKDSDPPENTHNYILAQK